MLLTFAFSARNFIKDVGSYAGFAAVIAMALFVLLLFSQAREIKRLREWGSQAHDRIGELERSVAAALDMARRAASRPAAPAPGPSPTQQARGPIARRPVGPAAATATAAAGESPRIASTSAPVRPQLLPAAPSGLAGPALASATALIPLPGTPASTAETAAPLRPATPAARPAAAGAGAGRAAAAAVGQRERVLPDNGSNGHHDDPPTEFPPPRRATPAPAAARPAAGGPPRRPAPVGPGARPRPGGRPQPAAAGRGGNGRGVPQEPEGSHGRRRVLAVVLVLLAVVVVAGGGYALLSGGSDSDSPTARVVTPTGGGTRRRAASRRAAARAPAAPAHADIRVAVLNGTGQTGLAGSVMGQLRAAGYPEGTTGDNGTGQTVTSVEYRGGDTEAAAREVARTLGLSADHVDAIQPATEDACAVATPCVAQVVVTVGTDLSQQ